VAKSKRSAEPSRNRSRNDNQAQIRKPVRLRVGEPWHVEVIKIRAKTQGRIATFLVVSLMLLLAACAVHAWVTRDREADQFITQFVTHGLSIAIGWAFGRGWRKGG